MIAHKHEILNCYCSKFHVSRLAPTHAIGLVAFRPFRIGSEPTAEERVIKMEQMMLFEMLPAHPSSFANGVLFPILGQNLKV